MTQYPLLLYDNHTMRGLPLEYAGMSSYYGVSVAHIYLNLSVLESETENPANAKYYQKYHGLLNCSSLPPYLPIFYSRPDFTSVDPAAIENLTFSDSIFTEPYDESDLMNTHPFGTWAEVEPYLGLTVYGNFALQLNLKYTPTSIFFPNVLPNFAPIVWTSMHSI
jgi:hypothetical protein